MKDLHHVGAEENAWIWEGEQIGSYTGDVCICCWDGLGGATDWLDEGEDGFRETDNGDLDVGSDDFSLFSFFPVIR